MGRSLLSRDFFTVAEVEGTPLAEDEPERLVDDGERGHAAEEWGVTTTHETKSNQLFALDRPVVRTMAMGLEWLVEIGSTVNKARTSPGEKEAKTENKSLSMSSNQRFDKKWEVTITQELLQMRRLRALCL